MLPHRVSPLASHRQRPAIPAGRFYCANAASETDAVATMIDLHNHILPTLDDGASDFEESVAIAREFVSEGVSRIVATPHRDPLLGNGAPVGVIEYTLAGLTEKLAGEEIPLRVEAGNELFLTPEAPALVREGSTLRLGESRAVLVEVSLRSRTAPPYMDPVLQALRDGGYQPVLAHPERYRWARNHAEILERLVAGGTLLQLTAPSLLGEYGPAIQRTAETILDRGLYTLAASDRHHPNQHRRSLALLYESIRVRRGADAADMLLISNPALLLDDLETQPVSPARRPVTWWTFFARSRER